MVQIHHVEVHPEVTHVLDKDLGVVRRQTQMVRESTVGTITHDGEVYEVADDGSFYVPEDVAAFMLRQPDWYSGPSPFEVSRRAQVPASQGKE